MMIIKILNGFSKKKYALFLPDNWGQANPDPTANAKILVIRFDNFTFIILDGAVSLFQLLA